MSATTTATSTTLPAGNLTNATNTGDKIPGTSGASMIFGIFVTVLFAALIERSKSKNPVPFTVSMIFFGGIIGVVALYTESLEQQLAIADINPLDILNIFLPILIFDGSFNLKLTTLIKVSFGSILLAGPGLLVNAVAMAGVGLAMYSNWTVGRALLFGGIISATDPVAVIARLKDLDADRWTTTLTDGEAILNDGTAVVMYEMLRGMAKQDADTPSGGDVVVSILRYCVLPIPLGLVIGAICSWFQQKSPTKPIIVTVLQLGGAYTAYFIAVTAVDTSSVITIMVMATYMNYHKAQYPKGEYDHMVKHFWEILVWIANALLFTLVGLISVLHVARRMESSELPLIAIMYVWCNVSRGLMLLMAWPFVNWGVPREADRMNWRRWIMLTYGGLRGGIALLLGLAVLQEKNNDKKFASQCFSQISFIVMLTSVINGWTAGPLVTCLGLDAKAAFSHHAMTQAVEEIKSTADERLQLHKSSEDDIFFIDWRFVQDKTLGKIKAPTNRLYSYEAASKMTRSSTMLHAEGSSSGSASGSSIEGEMSIRDEHDAYSAHSDAVAITNINGDLEKLTSSSSSASLPGSDSGSSSKRRPSQLADRSRRIISHLESSASAEVLIPILVRVMKRELWKMYDEALLTGRTISVLESFFEAYLADSILFTADDVYRYLVHEDRFSGLQHKARQLFGCGAGVEEDKAELLVSGMTAFVYIMRRVHHTITVLYGSMAQTFSWIAWSKIVLANAEELAQEIRSEHPQMARTIDSRRVAQEVLREAQETVDNISLMTGLTSKQREWLKDKLFRLAYTASHESPAPLLDDNSLIRKAFLEGAIVEECTEEERERLWEARTLASANEGAVIPLEPGHFGIVASGRVYQKERFTGKAISYVSTDYFGLSRCVRGVEEEAAVAATASSANGAVSPAKASASLSSALTTPAKTKIGNNIDDGSSNNNNDNDSGSADSRKIRFFADSNVAYLSIPFSVLQDIMTTNAGVRNAVYRREAGTVAEPILSQVYPTCTLSAHQRKLIVQHAELIFISENGGASRYHGRDGSLSARAPEAASSEDRKQLRGGSSGSDNNNNSDNSNSLTAPLNRFDSTASTTPRAGGRGGAIPASSALAGRVNRTTILLHGGSKELPSPQCMTIVPESLVTKWNSGTVLIVVHDLRLSSQSQHVTGVFFMDRAHQHVDVMFTSFSQASQDTQLFTLDRLLFALMEYVPCVFAWRHLLERSGLAAEFAAAVQQTQDLIDEICAWVFQRHVGGISAKEIVVTLGDYFEAFATKSAKAWGPKLVAWAEKASQQGSSGGLLVGNNNNNNNKTSGGTLSKKWSESPFEVCDAATLDDIAKKAGYRFPLRRSGRQGGDTGVRVAASTHETVFLQDELAPMAKAPSPSAPFFAQSPAGS